MEWVTRFITLNIMHYSTNGITQGQSKRENERTRYGSSGAGAGAGAGYFKMPLHYPRYKQADYEAMPEWQLDCLLSQYGLSILGDVDQKRSFAIGAFIWPSY